jgi:serine/threonine protein kinase
MIEKNPPYIEYPPERATTLILEQGAPPLKNSAALSPDLVNFVELSLKFNPAERATVHQLLEHPFMQRHANQPNPFAGGVLA